MKLLAGLCLTLMGTSLSAQAATLAPSTCKTVKPINASTFAKEVGQRHIAFFAKDLHQNTCYSLSPAAFTLSPTLRHTPWSTFKIPNLIIALETGTAPTLDYALPWNPVRRPRASYWPKDWAQRQTLASAFQRSAAWYFQDLALKIGSDTYRKWLKTFTYGNINVNPEDDAFWLNQTLQISPVEQVHFLSRLLAGDLPVSARTLKALDQVAFLKPLSPTAKLYGKTGSGPVVLNHFDGEFEGWLVGYVKREGKKPLVYALYAKGKTYQEIAKFRQQMSERLLKEIK